MEDRGGPVVTTIDLSQRRKGQDSEQPTMAAPAAATNPLLPSGTTDGRNEDSAIRLYLADLEADLSEKLANLTAERARSAALERRIEELEDLPQLAATASTSAPFQWEEQIRIREQELDRERALRAQLEQETQALQDEVAAIRQQFPSPQGTAPTQSDQSLVATAARVEQFEQLIAARELEVAQERAARLRLADELGQVRDQLDRSKIDAQSAPGQEIQQVRAELDERLAELEKAREHRARLLAELDGLRRAMEQRELELQDELSRRLQEEVHGLQGQVVFAREQRDEALAHLEDHRQEGNQLDDFRAELVRTQEELGSKETELEKVRAHRAELLAQVEQVRRLLPIEAPTDVAEAVDQVLRRLAELEADVASHHQDRAALLEELEGTRSRIESLEAERTRRSEDVGLGLSPELAERHAQVEQLRAEVESKENQLRLQSRQWQRAEERAEELARSLESLRREEHSGSAREEELRVHLAQIESQLSSATTALTSVQQELMTERAARLELEARRADLERAVNETSHSAQALEEHRAVLQQQKDHIVRITERLEHKDHHIERLSAELAEVRTTLQDQQALLATKEAQYWEAQRYLDDQVHLSGRIRSRLGGWSWGGRVANTPADPSPAAGSLRTPELGAVADQEETPEQRIPQMEGVYRKARSREQERLVWDYLSTKARPVAQQPNDGPDPTIGKVVAHATERTVPASPSADVPIGGGIALAKEHRPAARPRIERGGGGSHGARASPERGPAASLKAYPSPPAPERPMVPSSSGAEASPDSPRRPPLLDRAFSELTSSWVRPTRAEVEGIAATYHCQACGRVIRLTTRWPPHYLSCPDCGSKVL